MQPGDLVADRFELERLAKSGGMGAVYRAIDRKDGSAVAIKMLSGCSEQAASYFARESRIRPTCFQTPGRPRQDV